MAENSNQVFSNSDLVSHDIVTPKTLEQLALLKLVEINHKCLTEFPYCNMLKKYHWNDISKKCKIIRSIYGKI